MGAGRVSIAFAAAGLLSVAACGGPEETGSPEPTPVPSMAEPQEASPRGSSAPDSLPWGLLIAVSRFESDESGKPLPKSELVTLVRREGSWEARSYQDPESNVFHKAMVYAAPGSDPAILTLGGTAAAVKLWHPVDGGLVPSETLWTEDFGGRFSRMRDAEQGDLFGDGSQSLAVATHDQGVVAVVRPGAAGALELDRNQTPSSTRSRSAISTGTASSRSTRLPAIPTSWTAPSSAVKSCATSRRPGRASTVIRVGRRRPSNSE